FVDAVLTDECAMYQLDRCLFVVNGWNSRHSESQGWYHLQRTLNNTTREVVCMCTESRNSQSCLHTRFMSDYGDQKFPDEEMVLNGPSVTYLFSRIQDVVVEGDFITHFSVTSQSDQSTVKHRVVVEHRGNNSGGGTWKCGRDRALNTCSHISEARNTLQRLIQVDPTATDPNAQQDVNGVNSISNKPLPPPVWARIAGDGGPLSVPLMRTVPGLISLDSSSTCSCKEPRSMYDPAQPTDHRPCVIYGLLDASASCVELQKCPSCRFGYVGPECTNLGIFNFNNRSLFTIPLLDDYTSHITKSETPFVSWVASTSCRYEVHQSPIPFIKEKLFRSAWFSFARLLQLGQDMRCPKCGPTPQVTIWDGVTLSFSRKNLLSSLEPPTFVNNQSEAKPATRAETNLQFLSDRSLRKDIVTLYQGPTLVLPPLPSNKDNKETSIAAETMMKRISLIPGIVTRLAEIHPSLGRSFDQWSGTQLIFGRAKPHSVHRQFFLQIAAEETTVQFINGASLDNLERFLLSPALSNVFLLRGCPAIHNVVNVEFGSYGSLGQDILDLLRWIFIHASVVLSRLKKNGYPPTSFLSLEDNWQKTGSCYGMPQVCRRPKYPGLPKDNAADLGGTDLRGEGCQKFYSMFGDNCRTGGLMCVWCPHSVCYGFHIIPFAEGRNDVFSAIYTHWTTAPKVIVYDFACALQPYCMSREPELFADTLFVIDAFHAKGHTKCGRSSFLSNYLKTNPEFIMVNSSAGECGNSGILRIRKSVSYMSQDRAIIYTKIFLSIWNCHRIRKLE
ncbi:hypothetical protein CPB83DRAFT_733749, partial [Crepidotus variabilis]